MLKTISILAAIMLITVLALALLAATPAENSELFLLEVIVTKGAAFALAWAAGWLAKGLKLPEPEGIE